MDKSQKMAGGKVPFFCEDFDGDSPIDKTKYNCSKAEVQQICYNYSKAGFLVVGTQDFYNYAILDDIPVIFNKAK